VRTASSQHRTANWVIPIVLAIFMAGAASFTVVRAVILLSRVSPLVTQSRAARMHPPQTQP
jgi:hypothetical protein